MLGHQLPALPPIEGFLAELDAIFAWLEGGAQPSVPAALATTSDEDETWNPPPTIATWGTRAPLELVRFAATNRLCVELGYKGSVRVIEPYSLRQTRAGNLVLHALRADDRQHRSYRVDQIESVRATSRSFTPAYAVEFAASGPLSAPPARGGRRSPVAGARHTSRQPSGPEYVVECTRCGRRFRRRTRNTRMRRHKDPSGLLCAGTRGRLVG